MAPRIKYSSYPNNDLRVSMRCPACKQNGIFEPIGADVGLIASSNLVEMFFLSTDLSQPGLSKTCVLRS